MNIQSLTSKLTKGVTDRSKEVVFVVDNTKFDVTQVLQTPDEVLVYLEPTAEVHAGDSIENQIERSAEEEVDEEVEDEGSDEPSSPAIDNVGTDNDI